MEEGRFGLLIKSVWVDLNTNSSFQIFMQGGLRVVKHNILDLVIILKQVLSTSCVFNVHPIVTEAFSWLSRRINDNQ